MRAAPVALVRAVPAWAWLVGLVALSALLRYGLARRMPGPWIVIDELIYSELARGLAETGSFVVRGEPVGLGFGAVYPLLISPAYLIASLPDAYAAAKAINAVLVSLAAVPAYLLARRAVSQSLALTVALLTVAVPSLFYAGTIMTENAFYPVFLFVALALVRALDRPTFGRSALLGAAIGVAFLTRAQAVVLVAAVVTAPLLVALWERRARSLLAYRVLYGTIAAALGAVLLVAAAAGRTPAQLLGAYAAATDGTYRIRDVARWALYHVGELDLYVGVAPFAALLLLALTGRRLERDARLVVAAAVALTAWLVAQVAAFASLPSVSRIEERNMFYAAPLLFACLAVWIERGAPRPPVRTALAVGTAAVLPALIPYERLVTTSATSDTLAFLALWSLAEEAMIPLDTMWAYVLAGAVVAGALVAFLPRRALVAVPALLLALYAVAAHPVDARTREASIGALFQGIAHPDRAWVDGAVGRNADVAVLWTGRTDRFTVIQNEFFSRSVDGVYHTGEPVPGGLAQQAVAVDRSSGLILGADGTRIDSEYLLTDESLPISADVVARDVRRSLRLHELDGPARVESVTDGVYGDAWSGPQFTYTGFRCERGALAVRLASDPALFRRPQTVTAYTGSRPVARTTVAPSGDETTWLVPVEAGERCVLRFAVSPTAVPADVRAGNDDTRRLGVRVLSFERR